MKGLQEAMNKYNCVVAYSTVSERVKIGRDIKRACTTPKLKTRGMGLNKGRGKYQLEIKKLGGEPAVSLRIYRIRRIRGWDKERAYSTPKRHFHEY